MGESLLERLKYWVCRTFGHKQQGEKWFHAGKWHYDCARCRRVITENTRKG